jgi:fluoride exporter
MIFINVLQSYPQGRINTFETLRDREGKMGSIAHPTPRAVDKSCPHSQGQRMIWTLSQVAAGGAIGAVLRFATVLGAARIFGAGFPAGTMIVNIAGSFAMGFLFVILTARGSGLHPFLLTGILGGFTTFSAFSLEAVTLWERGEAVQAAIYVGASVILSILALACGAYLARAVT